jgi:DNA-binding MarR family transcriptional regulator
VLSREIESADALTLNEASILHALSLGPQRVTDLADVQALAQPATTQLVKRLEQSGLVRRERQIDDQRVVVVWLTDAGADVLRASSGHWFSTLGRHLEAMTDEELRSLADAADALMLFIAELQGEGRPAEAGRRHPVAAELGP